MPDGEINHLFDGHRHGGYDVLDSMITLCCKKHALDTSIKAGTVEARGVTCPEYVPEPVSIIRTSDDAELDDGGDREYVSGHLDEHSPEWVAGYEVGHREGLFDATASQDATRVDET